jgi:MOSC domain-containing protein YiiM
VTGRIVQISISPGGVPKNAVPSAEVTREGVEGDAHRDLEHHGGPDRAVCLFSLERIQALQAEGHSVVPGTLGENVTVEGIDWNDVVPGSRLELAGQVVLEVTRYTSPCVNIKPAFSHRDSSRVSEQRHPGWSRIYARVLVPGRMATGDPVRLLPAALTADREIPRSVPGSPGRDEHRGAWGTRG